MVKITIEPPIAVFRQAKVLAAGRGDALKRFFTETLTGRLRRGTTEARAHNAEPPWMAGFGALSDLGDDHRRIREAIEDEFERLTPENPA